MARHHELAGDVKQAIHFYTRAGAYNNVIRICKEHGFEDQLFNVALLRERSKHRNFWLLSYKNYTIIHYHDIFLSVCVTPNVTAKKVGCITLCLFCFMQENCRSKDYL